MDSVGGRFVCVSDVAKDSALLQVPEGDKTIVVSDGKDPPSAILLRRLFGANKRIRTEGNTCNTPGLGGSGELVLVEGKERSVGADVVQVDLSSRVTNCEDGDDGGLYERSDDFRGGLRARNGREDGVDSLAKTQSATDIGVERARAQKKNTWSLCSKSRGRRSSGRRQAC